MRIDGEFRAPHFGVWKDPDQDVPEDNVVVLGIGWTRDGYPSVDFLVHCSDCDDDEGGWRQAFTHAEHCPPWLWCETQFNQVIETINDDSCDFDPERN